MPLRARLLALLAVLATAAACATPADVAEPDTTVLTILLADDWASAPAVLDAITDFEQEHDVRVVVREAAFGALGETMVADRNASADLDVSQWHAFAAGQLGLAVPITDRFRAAYPEGTFVPGAVEDVTWGTEVYGVPLDTNAVVSIVNLDLLEEVGGTLDDLTSWAGVREVASAAAQDGVRYTYVPTSTWSTYAWLRSNGAGWFRFDDAGEVDFEFDDPRTRATFRFLADLTRDERLAFTSDTMDTSAEAYPLFEDQQMVALHSGTWDVARLQAAEPDFRWTVVPMPIGPDAEQPGTVLGGSSLYIPTQTSDVDLSWELVQHLVEPEYALRYARDDGRLPGRTDVLTDPFFDDERYATAVDALPTGSAMRLIAFPTLTDETTRVIHDVLVDRGGDVDAGFRRLQAEAADLLAEDVRSTATATDATSPRADG